MVMTALRRFFATPIKTAWADVAASAEYAPFIKQMAWREMRARYSFSKLGVLWVVLSFAVLIAKKVNKKKPFSLRCAVTAISISRPMIDICAVK